MEALVLPNTSFFHKKVNASTFLLIEDDFYDEQPHIYVRVYAEHLAIIDTGCNRPRSKEPSLTSLRKYLETYPLPSNNSQCLNPGGKKKYILICSHCHYDHILGIPQFLSAKPIIVASSFDRSFLLNNFPEHTLCKFIGVETPQYHISHWASNMSFLSTPACPIRIQFLHIPGHTPDSLACYDIDEHHLYVGDTFYERMRNVPIPGLPENAVKVQGQLKTHGAIIFPEEGGNWIKFMSSLGLLLSFVRYTNNQLTSRHHSKYDSISRVKVGCGHLTYDADAESMILDVQAMFERIIAGEVPVTHSEEKRGIVHDFWLESDDSKFSVLAPRHLAEEAKKHFHPIA